MTPEPIQKLLDGIATLRSQEREGVVTRSVFNCELDRLQAATRELGELLQPGQWLEARRADQREDAVKLCAQAFDVMALSIRKGYAHGPNSEQVVHARHAAIWLRLNVERRTRDAVGQEFGLAPAGVESAERLANAWLSNSTDFRCAVIAIQRILQADADAPVDLSNVTFLTPRQKGHTAGKEPQHGQQ